MDDLQIKHALTDKQWSYVLNRANGMEPIDAARSAYDYGPETKRGTILRASYDMERHPRIRAATLELTQHAVTDAVMGRREALERLSRIARASVADVVELSRDGDSGRTKLRFKSPEKINLECVSRMSDTHQGQNVQMHSPLVAIKQLAEMLGWEAPKRVESTITDGTHPDDAPVDLSGLTPETLMELWNAQAANKTEH